jgi:hypothetical protein
VALEEEMDTEIRTIRIWRVMLQYSLTRDSDS